LQKTRFVVQRQDEAVDFEQHLLFVGVGTQLAQSLHCSMARRMAACQVMHRAGQRIAHRAGAVVKLDSAADVDAARVDFDEVRFIQLSNIALKRAARRAAKTWRGRTLLARTCGIRG
jgi:hypothetical protein